MNLTREVAWILYAASFVVTAGAVTSEKNDVSATTTEQIQIGNTTKAMLDEDDDDNDYYYYDDVDNESSSDSDPPTTQQYETKTAEPKTVDSKLLFSYVVPAKEEEKDEAEDDHEDTEEEEEDGNESNVEEEEHSDDVRDGDEYEEDEDGLQRIERDEDELQRIEEDENEEESGRIEEDDEELTIVTPELKDKDEDDEDLTRWDTSAHNTKDHDDDVDEEEEEKEDEVEVSSGNLGATEDVAQRRNLDEEEEDHGPTKPPIASWRQSHQPFLRRDQPRYDFTTVQPHRVTRPVSYSSVVFDPDGNSKTEQSGSFYKKPLKVSPSSGVFPNGRDEDRTESGTKTVPVTTKPSPGERLNEEDEEEEEEDVEYDEPEAVTTNVKYAIEEKPPGTFAWLRKPQMTTAVPTVRPSFGWMKERVQKQKEPEEVTSKSYPSEEKETWEAGEKLFDEYEEELVPTSPRSQEKILVAFPKKTRMESLRIVATPNPEDATTKLNEEKVTRWPDPEYNERKVLPSVLSANTYADDTWQRVTRRPDPQKYERERPEPTLSNLNKDAGWQRVIRRPGSEYGEREKQESTVSTASGHEDGRDREDLESTGRHLDVDEFKDYAQEKFEEEPKMYNERARQQYHDRSNRENYYEQTINTRFRSKENGEVEGDDKYESEVRDLREPKEETVEEWNEESVNTDVEAEDATEDITESLENIITEGPPQKKDRNQLYEYVIDDGIWQSQAENKKPEPVTVAEVEPKSPLLTTTGAPSTTQSSVRHAKPQAYAFGTVARPRHGNSFHTFKNTEDEDVIYNQIVSNIQSLFTPSKPKPAVDYEHKFFPSHNCQTSQHPPSDSINYETFIRPSQTEHANSDEEDEDEEEEEDVNNPMPASKRLPVRMYAVHPKTVPMNPQRRPTAVKVTVYPRRMEARPASYRNSVRIPAGPVPSPNKLVRKVIYYRTPDKNLHLSPTNQIVRVIRPVTPVPSGRMLIIRKIH